MLFVIIWNCLRPSTGSVSKSVSPPREVLQDCATKRNCASERVTSEARECAEEELARSWCVSRFSFAPPNQLGNRTHLPSKAEQHPGHNNPHPSQGRLDRVTTSPPPIRQSEHASLHLTVTPTAGATYQRRLCQQLSVAPSQRGDCGRTPVRRTGDSYPSSDSKHYPLELRALH